MDGVIVVVVAGVLTTFSSLYSQEPCGEVMLGFSLVNTRSRRAFDGVLGGPRGEGKAYIQAQEAAKNRATIYAALVSVIDSDTAYGDVCGWTVSVSVEGDAVPSAVSFQMSSAAQYFNGGFDSTGIVDPAVNAGKQGFVSSILLTFEPCEIPRVSTTSILELEIEETEPHGRSDTQAVLRFEDGLRYRSDTPRQNVVLVRVEDIVPCNKDTASLNVVFWLPWFLRGDADLEGSVNLSDAIFILKGLFEESRADTCPAASDANTDGRVDISDAVYLLAYLHQGARSPSAPFPACGPDPAGEEALLPCLEPVPGCE